MLAYLIGILPLKLLSILRCAAQVFGCVGATASLSGPLVVVHPRIHLLLLCSRPGHLLLVVGPVVAHRLPVQRRRHLHDVSSCGLDNLFFCQMGILDAVLFLQNQKY